MKIVIVPIEPLETRYTGEWYLNLPRQLRAYCESHKIEAELVQIEVEAVSTSPTEGAFLDFSNTNAYKSKQFLALCEMFASFKAGDKILFTDAWNPTVIQLRYMKDLMKSPVELHGMWHAGSYDQHDFLGKAFDKAWSYNFERALYNAFDVNYFATECHADLLWDVLGIANCAKSCIVGWPMEYLKETLRPSAGKRELVVFPHRVSDEKLPQLFRHLSQVTPELEFVVCQDRALTKGEYHDILGQAKVVFSGSLQETLGIGMYEGYLCGATPVMPNRLSYPEMFGSCDNAVLYPSYMATPEYSEKDVYALRDLIRYEVQTWKTRENLGHSSLDSFFNGGKLYQSLVA